MGASDPELNTSGDLGGELEQMVIASKVHSSISNNTSTPIGYLPVELLSIIFGLCAQDDPDSLCVLELVNKQWHEILSSEHAPWQNLRLTDTVFDPVAVRNKTRLWFKRADTLPVHVNLDTRRRDSLLPMLSYLIPELHRWGEITFLERRLHFRFTPRPMSTAGMPLADARLESMLVTIQPLRDVPTDLTTSLNQIHSPSLNTYTHDQRSRSVVNFQDTNAVYLKELLVLGVRSLPSPETVLPFSTVTTLTLVNQSTDIDFPTHQSIPFLSAFPALQSLRFSNHNELAMVLDPDYRPDCSSIVPVVLPHLRFLVVMGICSSRCVLSHLATPNLSALHLIHINSSTEYDHPRMYEPGDSDDEANDFSRSPWTDHATGMGLRNLFRNGVPPLRELVMDYADLRTKDFKWLFERMPGLETFHIVASDLSDNVVRALIVSEAAQSSHTGDLDSDVCMDSTVEQQQQKTRESPGKILLPRLSRLKLAKCQRMTGDTVVLMVRSRVRAAVEGRVTMLKELGLMECSQVSESHSLELQELDPSISNFVYVPGFED